MHVLKNNKKLFLLFLSTLGFVCFLFFYICLTFNVCFYFSSHLKPNTSSDTLQSITSGDWDVTQVLAYNEESQLM